MVFQFLSSFINDDEEKSNSVQGMPPLVGTQQGQLYLAGRRRVTNQLKPSLKLIESFDVDTSLAGAVSSGANGQSSCNNVGSTNCKGATYNAKGVEVGYSECSPNYSYCPPDTLAGNLLYQKDDNPSEVGALKSKFDSLLSQYGTAYKNYNENLNRYVNFQNSSYAGKNITTPDGNRYYVNKFGFARYYTPSVWNSRPGSCRGGTMPVSSNNLGDLGIAQTSSMSMGQPCGFATKNVIIPQLQGPESPANCSIYQAMGGCPSGYNSKVKSTVCKFNPCTKGDCCTKYPTCSATFTCPQDMVRRSGTIPCPTGKCDENTCCIPRARCSSFNCDAKHHRSTSGNTFCDGSVCLSKECCAPNPICSSYGCPTNYVKKGNPGDITCLTSGSNETGSCTTGECCNELPARTPCPSCPPMKSSSSLSTQQAQCSAYGSCCSFEQGTLGNECNRNNSVSSYCPKGPCRS